ncbi:hypothetical protein AQF52_6977 [Streptomyces venezuelae]|uniref:Uncharacterized protein n=1 Tax=Streptomyces zaomyceticus TaxID=68286 RepID=A0ABZ1L425_9ACTN|nr:hypothetical protein [Streptomyces gardneri]ALO12563.1 hypothetical protein AQF52_6977 [Streptomyces venezuelae]QPK49313.1 hypothetical protein H4W23_35020 [Streptomyces gardneri]WRK40833.1 hypothetical protein U0M97_35225 [Streptomyces venezuelae]CUM36807.1 hypothetical protein BN2537_2579 [Streptomyces venezuelae]
MDELLSAAFGFPVLLFSVAVVAAVGFWLLVLCGVAEHGAFDSDVDTQTLRLGRVPVSVAASVFLLAGWLLSLTGALLRDLADLSRSSSSLLSLALMVLAPAAAWWVTRRLVRPLAKLFPDEPGPSRRSAATLP